ncbi:hypothetical protein BOTBODRAFT_427204 [Botryobasidium botryosum FD-172 SS1]|uniref:Uncharacterized protein n=1 Tax=Botryobasidium botryosum (strain FD-172 SS1) TaxID=930990 RepID=A0A067MJA9_BOTB1|nr:hypothetical protein BOTBODRAFT_427204 [Botryobasidium botryosum FD-172 SS1]
MAPYTAPTRYYPLKVIYTLNAHPQLILARFSPILVSLLDPRRGTEKDPYLILRSLGGGLTRSASEGQGVAGDGKSVRAVDGPMHGEPHQRQQHQLQRMCTPIPSSDPPNVPFDFGAFELPPSSPPSSYRSGSSTSGTPAPDGGSQNGAVGAEDGGAGCDEEMEDEDLWGPSETGDAMDILSTADGTQTTMDGDAMESSDDIGDTTISYANFNPRSLDSLGPLDLGGTNAEYDLATLIDMLGDAVSEATGGGVDFSSDDSGFNGDGGVGGSGSGSASGDTINLEDLVKNEHILNADFGNMDDAHVPKMGEEELKRLLEMFGSDP